MVEAGSTLSTLAVANYSICLILLDWTIDLDWKKTGIVQGVRLRLLRTTSAYRSNELVALPRVHVLLVVGVVDGGFCQLDAFGDALVDPVNTGEDVSGGGKWLMRDLRAVLGRGTRVASTKHSMPVFFSWSWVIFLASLHIVEGPRNPKGGCDSFLSSLAGRWVLRTSNSRHMQKQQLTSHKPVLPRTAAIHMGSCGVDGVQIVSRRLVRPSSISTTANGSNPPTEEAEVIHLTPWDLRLLTTDYIQKGVLLPKALTSGGRLVSDLAASLARALGRFYAFAGRLDAQQCGDGTVTVSLRCTGDGAEVVHAVAPGVAVAHIADSLYTPPVVWSLFSFNQVLGGDAAFQSLPVLSVQITELADGVFIAMSMNHSVGDGTTFWDFFNTWSELNRCGSSELSTPAPVLQRWFVETSPVPIPLPLGKLQRLLRPFARPTVQECFFTFSTASVRKLKARANDEMAGRATATISSLQAVFAHVWRALCRARRLPPEQDTVYYLIVGCRGRVAGIAPGYVGNAVMRSEVPSTAGEIERNGLGWTAWLLNRSVASFDELRVRGWLGRWVREPEFAHMGSLMSDGAAVTTGSSPRFDVFGNDFGWGTPVAVRSGAAEKMDGATTVFKGREKGGSISLEVCVKPGVLPMLVADKEFMDAVTLPAQV
ncbi:hypothetical protein C2845_PM05G18320 [Panicum miliaceum]|uniref:Acetyltransferase n=1 Tax=Panicum miliaceum TaxID=4540 RepID=A0A3L6T0B4_PANMI|nr:hypothetical protein C2845_PM05G18320 [Panicum miliaceum]